MIRESVSLWLQYKPTIKQFENTKLFEVIKKMEKLFQTEIMESSKIQKELDRLEGEFDSEEINFLKDKFGIIERRSKEVSRKKKQGRPTVKKKRVKRIK